MISERNRRIFSEYQNGKSLEVLAETYGIKPSTIRSIISDIRCHYKHGQDYQDMDEDLQTEIEKLPLPPKTQSKICYALMRGQIFSMKDLKKTSIEDLKKMRMIGKKSIDALVSAGLVEKWQ